MSIPEPVGFTDEGSVVAPSVRTFTVLTVNTHKGFTALNRRFILPQLREAVRSVGADMVFLQEIHGTHERHPQRYPWRNRQTCKANADQRDRYGQG